MSRPIEGAILQVSVPALVVGGVWALAGETAATASATSTVATKCLNMTGFLKLLAAGLNTSSTWHFSGQVIDKLNHRSSRQPRASEPVIDAGSDSIDMVRTDAAS
jgi:hypothetical protein